MSSDPFDALGLPSSASADEVRAARRRLAKAHHPDAGGDADLMSAVNDAAAAALRAIAAPSRTRQTRRRDDQHQRHHQHQDQHQGHGHGDNHGAGQPEWSDLTHDVSSFTVEALPAETFEALLVVTTWIGEVVDDDPPYRLETRLQSPAPCWCRLELVPEAGASTVSITLATDDGGPAPNIELVRDTWVDNLNQYDW